MWAAGWLGGVVPRLAAVRFDAGGLMGWGEEWRVFGGWALLCWPVAGWVIRYTPDSSHHRRLVATD